MSKPSGLRSDQARLVRLGGPCTNSEPEGPLPAFAVCAQPSAGVRVDMRQVECGPVENYKKGGGAAVKISKSELAVWHHLGTDKWYAAQNSCPHKQLQVLSRGLVGFHGDVPKVACPIHKNTYNLDTGKGISNPGYNLSTFNVKEEGGKIFVQVPPDDVLDKALAREDPKGNCGGACEAPKDLQW